MCRVIFALAGAVAVVAASAFPAAASDKTEVMATVNQFCGALNKGDTQTAIATCAAQASIIDEFPPVSLAGRRLQ